MRIQAFVCAFVLAGCTSIPDRFVGADEVVADCGYRTEAEDPAGFALEVAFRKFSFLPNPDAAVEEARECFKRTASTLAQRQGKRIKPLTVADMNASPTRNVVDGKYLVYVTGKVAFSQ